MENGNLILPPFRATDYNQEVHAQVSTFFNIHLNAFPRSAWRALKFPFVILKLVEVFCSTLLGHPAINFAYWLYLIPSLYQQ